jgi:hypothetical protein
MIRSRWYQRWLRAFRVAYREATQWRGPASQPELPTYEQVRSRAKR